jgi:hypothetical protein
MYKKKNRIKKGGRLEILQSKNTTYYTELDKIQLTTNHTIERDIYSINENNTLYGTLLSTDENNKINENIPLIYKQKIIQIFENYKATNNGLIIGNIPDEIKKMYENILTNHKKIKYLNGGISINTSDINILNELNDYCRDIDGKDETDISNYINNNGNNKIDKYNNLKQTINDNQIPINNSLTIDRRPIYNYSSGKIDTYESTYRFFPNIQKSYNCFEYNKDIVTAFESNYYSTRNINAIEKFIIKQKEYIDSLDIRKKRIIQDYTNDNSYTFYREYINKKSNWINHRKFGDAFYIQIYELYPNDFSYIIGNPNMTYDIWINNKRIDNFEEQSSILLSPDKWEIVLDKFMEDLNEIIMNAPPIEEEIYCYRGVTSHFITGGNSSTPVKLTDSSILTHSIKSHKIYSFSLDFNVAYKFYNLGNSDDKAIYRITILPQCRVLYVEQLSIFKGELEFIAPNNSIFYYNIDNATNTELKPSIAYNNITKKYGICPNIGFYSFDSVLAFTPQPDEITDEMIHKAINIAINTAKNFTHCSLISNTTEVAIVNAEIFTDNVATAFLNICSASKS